MVYDSLLLERGGGIVAEFAKNMQNQSSAALVLGLGGTGLEALSRLKGKIRERLLPDAPGERRPRYDGIQLLGIDSDPVAEQRFVDDGRLEDNEFFSIANPGIRRILKDGSSNRAIKDNPCLSWLDVDKIEASFLYTSSLYDGTGGIRQIGRYLLFNKVDSLTHVLTQKIHHAIMARATASIDVYVFAGLSGGTGSAIYADLCYILRKIFKHNAWDGKIFGYFFLPDVVLSKAELAADASACRYNNANGYAALRELDRFMNLKRAGAWFEQQYGPAFCIHTQEPPVDLCHLVSATDADGVRNERGYEKALDVATEHVLAHLSDVPATLGGGLFPTAARRYLSDVTSGVTLLPDFGKENLCYHAIGACRAEIPFKEIMTDLSCSFFNRYFAVLDRAQKYPSKEDVERFVKGVGLSVDALRDELRRESSPLCLPDVDRRQLYEASATEGAICSVWANAGEEWSMQQQSKTVSRINALQREEEKFDRRAANGESLVGRVFHTLWGLACDPAYGHLYAARLLKGDAYDLSEVLRCEIVMGEEWLMHYKRRVNLSYSLVEETKAAFRRSNIFNRARLYDDYKNAVTRFYHDRETVSAFEGVCGLLYALNAQVKRLHQEFFYPLTVMLNALDDTFAANRAFLNRITHDRRIVTVGEIRNRLDACVSALPDRAFSDFTAFLLEHSDRWIRGDHEQIGRLIREEMLRIFGAEASRSFEDYLDEKYPQAAGDPAQLATIVRKEFLEDLYESARPDLFFDFAFDAETKTFRMGSFEVPAASPACGMAGVASAAMKAPPMILKTGEIPCLTALRTYNGVPLRAIRSVEVMKAAYDAGSSAGIQLDKKWITE